MKYCIARKHLAACHLMQSERNVSKVAFATILLQMWIMEAACSVFLYICTYLLDVPRYIYTLIVFALLCPSFFLDEELAQHACI